MHIAFVTTCLEPGRDGVGDYTRDLAAACIRMGHTCTLLAVNDSRIDAVREQPQAARGIAVETLRLPASASWPERIEAARAWLARSPADWLSLQFVPYGFHPKGLVAGLGERLAPLLGAARNRQLMFHELWIGAERGTSLKNRLVGWAQRRAVVSFVRRMSPHVIHTSNEAYRSLAADSGMRAELLPLCGSIPIAQSTDPQWLASEWLKLGVSAEYVTPRERCWWFGVFGSIHPEWAPEPLFSYIAEAAERAQRRVLISSVGRQGSGAGLWRDLQARYGSRFAFCTFGEREPLEVSRFLGGLDFGIATTPWQIIGKSATAAAMIDHGLPVIVSRDDVQLRLSAPPTLRGEPLLHKMDSTLPQWLAGTPARAAPRDGLANLAERFLRDLKAAPGR